MISLAQLIEDRSKAGLPVLDEFEQLPAWQMQARWTDLAPLCPSRLALGVERRPANALCMEVGQPLPRCAEKSPDGRGRLWLLSGGSPLAYGPCKCACCPRTE